MEATQIKVLGLSFKPEAHLTELDVVTRSQNRWRRHLRAVDESSVRAAKVGDSHGIASPI